MDNEVKQNPTTGESGVGNSYDFGARIYDSRLGRWWCIDAATKRYIRFTPYGYVANNPIVHIEVGGDNWQVFGNNADITALTNAITVMFNNKIIAQVDAGGMIRLHMVIPGGGVGNEIDMSTEVGKKYVNALNESQKKLFEQLNEITSDRSFAVKTDVSTSNSIADFMDAYSKNSVPVFEIFVNDFDIGTMVLSNVGVPAGTAEEYVKSGLVHAIREAYAQQVLSMHDPTGANRFGYIPSHVYALDQQSEFLGLRIRKYQEYPDAAGRKGRPRVLNFNDGSTAARTTLYAVKKRGWFIFDWLIPDEYYKIEVDQDNVTSNVTHVTVTKVEAKEANQHSRD